MNPASNDVCPVEAMAAATDAQTATASPAGSSRPLGSDVVDRAVILQLLEVPGPAGMDPLRLRDSLADIPAQAIAAALLRLQNATLVHWSGAELCASPAARYLDRLDLIAL